LVSPNPFAISDLSHGWIMCDVYENDLSNLRVSEYSDIRLSLNPNMVRRSRTGNINPVLDSNLRTAKGRLEGSNPGMLRLGMFVTASLHGLTWDVRAAIPPTVVLHLRGRDWVYAPDGAGRFLRIPVVWRQTIRRKLNAVNKSSQTPWFCQARWSSNDSRSR
jgi:cobalt-zinc-cadmium efflux system membrane fusion protein